MAAQIQVLNSPYRHYRVAADRFLAYLQTDFPHLDSLSELRRDPHLLGWIRGLCQQDPPLSHSTRRIYLTCLRRLLRDSAPEGQPGLILPEDFPPRAPQPRATPQKDTWGATCSSSNRLYRLFNGTWPGSRIAAANGALTRS